ncbi:transposase [Rhodococcus opacus PD630]|nr:Transposase for insertion sequence element IS1557 [Rhodococcus opacus PD630]EHI43563.1 transposase [Rhodococcus opacus PD630]
MRRQVWQHARSLSDKQIAKTYRGARWALLKNPESLSVKQASTLKALKRQGGALVRAYDLKEALRTVFAGDLDDEEVIAMLARWCVWAQRCRIPQFVKLGRTIRKHLDGITATVERGLANGRHEGLNNKVRLIIRRAYGFHTAENALALILLACGPVTLTLPYHTVTHPHSSQESLFSCIGAPVSFAGAREVSRCLTTHPRSRCRTRARVAVTLRRT